MPHYDVAVVGLGAMGSQTALELASRGRRVLGLDRYRPPHTLGSTHGRTRIIREAYFEEPLYVPIVQRAYELWRRLEERSGTHVLTVTGGLMLGAPDSEVVAGARASAVEHGLPYEELSAREVRERFPAYAVPDEHVGRSSSPGPGFLEPEAAVEATLALAAEAGADLRFDEPVLELDGNVLRTERGTYAADRIVVSAGPWLPDLLPDLAGTFTAARQPLLWLAPREPELFGPDRFPVFVWEWQPGWAFYGFPDVGDGFKVAVHHHGERTTPDTVERELRDEDEDDDPRPRPPLLPRRRRRAARGGRLPVHEHARRALRDRPPPRATSASSSPARARATASSSRPRSARCSRTWRRASRRAST